MGQYCKRLIEVDLPIRRISEHARKQHRCGRIATLHAWWARKPLSACRAVICASLWPDPDDKLCPSIFRETARKQMEIWAQKHLNMLSTESYSSFIEIAKDKNKLQDNKVLRKLLLAFITDFSSNKNGTNEKYLETVQYLTRIAHLALGGIEGTKPLLVDPFAGGGSIPLESLRIGANTFCSDLNPVAVLLNKVVVEYIPKFGEKLAIEVKRWGKWIANKAENELSAFYPKRHNGLEPVNYIWARTVICEGPNCGAVVPMKSTMWLAQKTNRRIALSFNPNRKTKALNISIEINPDKVDCGTVKRGSVTCPFSGYTTAVNNIRKQLQKRNGGTEDSMLLAVIFKGQNGNRLYMTPKPSDLKAIESAKEFVNNHISLKIGTFSYIPKEPTPPLGSHRSVVTPRIYGINEWRYLFLPRQLASLVRLSQLIKDCSNELGHKCQEDLQIATQTVLGLVINKVAQYNSSACRWKAKSESFVDMFGHHAFPFGWDFAESNPISKSSGSFIRMCASLEKLISDISSLNLKPGTACLSSATSLHLPNGSAQIVVTDPPYYDAVSYGDLSDFFYVWLKRSLNGLHTDILSSDLIKKDNEIIVKHPNNDQEHIYFLKKWN